MKKAKTQEITIKYKKISDFKNMKILAMSDGGLNRREDKTQSIMGQMVFLSDKEEKNVAPLLWKSKIIRTVCKSSKSAETRAFDKTAEEAI